VVAETMEVSSFQILDIPLATKAGLLTPKIEGKEHYGGSW
jgi:hypothetical protein